MTEAEYIAAAEARRKRRERELLLLLLLALQTATAHGLLAFRHGLDWISVVINTLRGSEAAALRGITAAVAEQLAIAHRAGAMLAAAKVGAYYLPGKAELIRAYQNTAAEFVEAAIAGISRAFRAGIVAGGSVREAIAGIRAALKRAGYSSENPFALRAGIERIIVTAFNAGVFDAAVRGVLNRITGFRHVSIIDPVTTEICLARDGLQLSIAHVYWLTNWPSLHYNCRSVIVPIAGRFQETEALPDIPPMAGFGRIPTGILDLIARERAAA